jgi:hypothetical protein
MHQQGRIFCFLMFRVCLRCCVHTLPQDLLRVSARHRVLLTGTPLQNSLEELFFLMNFLEPAKFASVDDFKQAYAALDDKDKVRAGRGVALLELKKAPCGIRSSVHGKEGTLWRVIQSALRWQKRQQGLLLELRPYLPCMPLPMLMFRLHVHHQSSCVQNTLVCNCLQVVQCVSRSAGGVPAAFVIIPHFYS